MNRKFIHFLGTGFLAMMMSCAPKITSVPVTEATLENSQEENSILQTETSQTSNLLVRESAATMYEEEALSASAEVNEIYSAAQATSKPIVAPMALPKKFQDKKQSTQSFSEQKTDRKTARAEAKITKKTERLKKYLEPKGKKKTLMDQLTKISLVLIVLGLIFIFYIEPLGSLLIIVGLVIILLRLLEVI